ncbi:hypothetical protein HDU97_005398 [Phlyctochytrium planicorne]|nr:hypothetical protein HDU97_005398 [Phlyctochytrium planicorne]
MEDALVERIITLPNPEENDYLLMEATGLQSRGIIPQRAKVGNKGGVGKSNSSLADNNKPNFTSAIASRRLDRQLLSEKIHQYSSTSNPSSEHSSIHVPAVNRVGVGTSKEGSLRSAYHTSAASSDAQDEDHSAHRARDIETLREHLISSHRNIQGQMQDPTRREKERQHKRTVSESAGKLDSVPPSMRHKDANGRSGDVSSRLGMIGYEDDGKAHTSLPSSIAGSRRGSAVRVDANTKESENVSLANSFKQSLKADALAQAEGISNRRVSIASSAESIHVDDLDDDLEDIATNLSMQDSRVSGSVRPTSLQPPTAPRGSEVNGRHSYMSQMDNREEEEQAATQVLKEEDLRALFQKVSISDNIQSSITHRLEEKAQKKSALSKMLKEQNTSDNPFATDFSYFSGKGDPDPMRLKIYIPFSSNSEKPLLVIVKKEATVEEVIGYCLYEYTNEGREPLVPKHLWDVANWNMRIVEDDGTIDEDFPALERTRRIQKFSFDQFAICQAPPDQVRINEANRQATSRPVVAQKQALASNPAAQATPPRTILLKVHLYSTLEVKQTTTIPMQSNMLMSEIFEVICRKRKYDPKNYVLKMADTRTDVPLDKTLESLKVNEFCVLKRDRGGAGDIFLRPPDEVVKMDTVIEQPRFMSDEYSSMYKQYYVMHKMLMGKHERLLTIDGDHVHLMPVENKRVFDIMKTTSYHCSSIISCKQTKKQSPHFKMMVKKGNNSTATYDLEAATPQEAADACAKVAFIVQMNQRQAA